MATTAGATLITRVLATMDPSSPIEGTVRGDHENGTKGVSWTNGSGSGQIDQVYRATHTIGAAATVNFDLLAAGALTDITGATIDLDELKFLKISVTSGQISFLAPAANFLDLFIATGDALDLSANHGVTLEWGAAGLDVTTNSKFDITDLAGGSGSVVEVSFGGAK
jgi:hypothetical protein